MRVVVTGGPGSGKTTLVEALGARGFGTVPEAAIQVIEELNAELGVEGQKAWRRENRSAFQVRVLRRQVALEEAAVPGPRGVVFLDRCRLDGLAYCRHFDLVVPPELVRAAAEGRYDRALLLDTLATFGDRGATGRTSDRAASLALRERLAEVYREHGLEPLRLPELPVEERADRALALLGIA